MKCVRVRIEGRVQGVGYRAWVEENALELGLAGWVRNRRDRSVEALFRGPADRVDDMLRRCEKGPTAARVTRVEAHATDERLCEGFQVLATC